jgi:hypothetical protein
MIPVNRPPAHRAPVRTSPRSSLPAAPARRPPTGASAARHSEEGARVQPTLSPRRDRR